MEKEIKLRIDEYLRITNDFFACQNYVKVRETLVEAWEFLPDSKIEFDESYHIAKYIIDMSLRLGELQVAKKWADILMKCNLNRYDSGEREFIKGRVLYELGEFPQAKEYFIVGNKKSKGRCFIDYDSKYKLFALSK
jgi:hypothetical protein